LALAWGTVAGAQAPTSPPLSVKGKYALLEAAAQVAIPRGGRWAWLYRPWGCPRTDEVVVSDSAAEPAPGVDRIETPCWLKQTVSLVVEGLVDGDERPYSGPLAVTASAPLRVLGPYPEGFVCCLNGGFRIDLLADEGCQYKEDLAVNVEVSYRVPPVELTLADGPWPPYPDLGLASPPVTVPVGNGTVWFRPVGLEGNQFSEVQNFAAAGVRELRVEARCVLPSGRPAARLPMEFAWRFIDAPDLKEKEIVHLGETSPKGEAADSVQVPAIAKKGWVEIKCHTNGDAFSTLAVKQFDFTKPQE
jgi:hypothetical protein